MDKIQDNIPDNKSNSSGNSENTSRLVSSSSYGSESKKNKTLHNFSESYIVELSKKIKNKSFYSAKKQSLNFENDNKNMSNSSPLPKNQSENFQKNEDLSKNEEEEKEEINVFINDLSEGSKGTTKKDYTQIDEIDEKSQVFFLF